jgi:trehalose-phosphatase
MIFFKKRYRKYPLVWRKGKKVWELRPDVSWGKGHMADYLAKKYPGALTIAIGDDVTDEDMFKVLKRRGLTARVGFSKLSAADYYLRSPADVVKFLKKLSLRAGEQHLPKVIPAVIKSRRHGIQALRRFSP